MFKRIMFLAIVSLLAICALPMALAQADCDFSYSNYARAVLLHDMGDYGRALVHYRCAQLEDPDDAIIPILIENVHEDIAAPSAWSRADGGANPGVCDPALDHAQLGRQAYEASDYQRALMHLECVLSFDPQDTDALHRIALIYLYQADSHSALHYFNRIGDVEAAASAASADEDLLTALLGEDARNVLDEDDLRGLTLTSPDPAETGEYRPPGHDYQRTVLIVIWTNRRDRAVDARRTDDGHTTEKLEAALGQAPERIDLRCDLARLYHERGDYAAAFNHYYFLIRETLGGHCNSASPPNDERTEASLSPEDLERALERAPARADLRCELARMVQERGDYAAAYYHYSYLIREALGDYC